MSERSKENRIKDNKAFTLAEALVAILILLMVTAIVAAGIPAASRAYTNVVNVSNAEVLLSTTMNSLRNELGLARDVTVKGTTVTYYNETYDTLSRLSVDTETDGGNNMIMYERYISNAESDDSFGIDINLDDKDESVKERFISKEASNENLYVTYESITPDPDGKCITFNNLKVCREGTDTPLVERSAFSIRIISA